MDIIQASREGREDVVSSLLEAGAFVNYIEGYGWTPIVYTTRLGKVEIVKRTVDPPGDGADVDFDGGYGGTALIYASRWGHINIVKLLIDAGADLSIRQRIISNTALHHAAKNGHVEIVKLLLDAGAYILSSNVLGESPILYAAEHDNVEILEIMLQRRSMFKKSIMFEATKCRKSILLRRILSTSQSRSFIDEDALILLIRFKWFSVREKITMLLQADPALVKHSLLLYCTYGSF